MSVGAAAVWRLGAVEARRLVCHPVYPVAMLYIAAYVAGAIRSGETGPAANGAYVVVMLSLLLVYAPATVVAGNRVAAATFRSRVHEPLDGTPVGVRQHTAAAIIGVLRGPALVSLAATGLLQVIGEFTTAHPERPIDVVHHRAALEYLQIPAVVLGAGLLGVAVARWLPRPGALPLTVLLVWISTVPLYQPSTTGTPYDRTWFALWPVWLSTDAGLLPRQPLDQEMWHLAYLLGLGVLAAIAALLRTAGPRRALCAAAVVAAVATAAADAVT
ncbi:hypothetical protein Aph02nite_79190 [Actinoplanes philippinensis]|uniref:ABC-2 type transport system permease protein n=1 Tax=Actinoplanes philippinensis TaxID=35752 RepID=A0A1I2KFT7_9ACTN|nr:hypothetical protein [Actinoplanes philippinensis]GIE81969.1 hypothetical protein Aph02nite_79190 [Actinoplanes philippinensis]SFF65080.1 hypothetical protein SAMN05421541_116147 [Actinoplanes philippinensis]